MRCCCLLALLLIPGYAKAAEPEIKPFTQKERVVLLGGVFCERETEYGLIELTHQLAFPAQRIEFRNLGWSGDTVYGESRAYFGPVSAGYQHLLEYTRLAKPTLIYCCYGLSESYSGSSQLEPFKAQYSKLIDDLSEITPRIVLITPTPLVPEEFPPAQQAISAHKHILFDYVDAIRELGQTHQIPVVDLYGEGNVSSDFPGESFTTDGLHLTKSGYRWAAAQIINAFDQPAQLFKAISDTDKQNDLEPLVNAIRLKNEFYFHRFRPQNETYLRGFRKHEQGQNAVEILEYEPLIERQDDYLHQTKQAVIDQLQ